MSTDDRSPEEQEISKLLADAGKQIEDIKTQIDNLHNDNGPALRPPGMPPESPFGSKARKTLELQEKIDTIKKEALEKADKILETASPDIKNKGTIQTDAWLEPVPKAGSQEKTLDESQRYASKLSNKHRNKEQESVGRGPAVTDVHDPDTSSAYMNKILQDRKAQTKDGVKDLDASQTFATKVLEDYRAGKEPVDSKDVEGMPDEKDAGRGKEDSKKRIDSSFSMDQPYSLNVNFFPIADEGKEAKPQDKSDGPDKENKEQEERAKDETNESRTFSMETTYTMSLTDPSDVELPGDAESPEKSDIDKDNIEPDDPDID